MESQASGESTFQDALAQHHAQLIGQFEDESKKRLAKHEKQKIHLQDELDSLKQKLRKSTHNSEEIQRLRDENANLARENAHLRKQAVLATRQSEEYREAAMKYKGKFRSAKDRVVEWQEYADRHSPKRNGRAKSAASASLATTSRPVTPLFNVHQRDPAQADALDPKEHLRGCDPPAIKISPKRTPLLPTPAGSSSHEHNVTTIVLDSSIPGSHVDACTRRSDARLEDATNTPHDYAGNEIELADSQPLASPKGHETRIASGQIVAQPSLQAPSSVQPSPQSQSLPRNTLTSASKTGAGANERRISLVAPAIPSSQSTDEEEDLAQAVHASPVVDVKQEATLHSSAPIVISERQLKRKRRDPIRSVQRPAAVGAAPLSDGSATKPYLIKEEQYSIAEGVGRMARLQNISSMDLDEVSQLIDTPRKRQRLQRLHYSRHLNGMSQRMSSNLGHNRATSAPLGTEDCEDRELSQCVSERLAQSFDGHAVTNLKATSQFQERDAVGDPATQTSGQQSRMLQPISPNRQNISVAGNRNRGCRGFTTRDKALEQLIEDGESMSIKTGAAINADVQTIMQVTEKTGPQKTPGQRIQLLLQTTLSQEKREIQTPEAVGKLKRPSTERMSRSVKPNPTRIGAPPLLVTPQPQVKIMAPKLPVTEPRRPRRSTNSPSKDSSRRPESAKGRAPETKQRPPRQRTPSPSHEPLSARPLNRLTLQDFKINPAYNGGLKFAYDDTVRKIKEKACLPGCTDSRCCGGQFRRMVELGIAPGVANGQASSLDTPRPYAGEGEADLARLEAHLGGGDFAKRQIRDMDPTQRANAIVQAKAAEIAQKFGKHRQRNERRMTPPGFWDSEVPSTQKLEEHRAAVAKMERDTVQSRYKEAKREDHKGRWMFRDE